jgi:HEAT repeat protein
MSAPRLASAALALCLLASAAIAGDPPAAAPPEPAKLAESLKSKEKADRLAAARDAKDVQDEKLTAPLAALLDDDEAAIRHAAIEALGRRTAADAQKKAASALASHVTKVAKRADAEVELIAAVQALGVLAQPSSLDALTSDIEIDTPLEVVRARLTAVANLPSPEAIDALIQFLAKQGRGKNGAQREACRAALRDATGQNLGNDPDAWRAWWKDAKKDFDFAAAAERRAAEREAKDEKDRKKRERQEKRDGGGERKKDGDEKK